MKKRFLVCAVPFIVCAVFLALIAGTSGNGADMSAREYAETLCGKENTFIREDGSVWIKVEVLHRFEHWIEARVFQPAVVMPESYELFNAQYADIFIGTDGTELNYAVYAKEDYVDEVIGSDYILQVKLEGLWYNVPSCRAEEEELQRFPRNALMRTCEEEWEIKAYGEHSGCSRGSIPLTVGEENEFQLPPGHYRMYLAGDGCYGAKEFDLKLKDGKYSVK